MRINTQGWSATALAAIPSAIAAATGRPRVAGVLMSLPAAALGWHRDPARHPDSLNVVHPERVLSPVDGRVAYVGPARTHPQDKALAGAGETSQLPARPESGPESNPSWQQISVAPSPVDVRVMRSPYLGRVIDLHSGGSRGRSQMTMRTSHEDAARVVIWRISRRLRLGSKLSFLARLWPQVRYQVAENQLLRPGERTGLAPPLSRIDVFLPPQASILVNPGERTKAGETTLATFVASGAPRTKLGS